MRLCCDPKRCAVKTQWLTSCRKDQKYNGPETLKGGNRSCSSISTTLGLARFLKELCSEDNNVAQKSLMHLNMQRIATTVTTRSPLLLIARCKAVVNPRQGEYVVENGDIDCVVSDVCALLSRLNDAVDQWTESCIGRL
ncbi:hypothetical protein Tco_0689692 [Tanacetum coccineum]